MGVVGIEPRFPSRPFSHFMRVLHFCGDFRTPLWYLVCVLLLKLCLRQPCVQMAFNLHHSRSFRPRTTPLSIVLRRINDGGGLGSRTFLNGRFSIWFYYFSHHSMEPIISWRRQIIWMRPVNCLHWKANKLLSINPRIWSVFSYSTRIWFVGQSNQVEILPCFLCAFCFVWMSSKTPIAGVKKLSKLSSRLQSNSFTYDCNGTCEKFPLFEGGLHQNSDKSAIRLSSWLLCPSWRFSNNFHFYISIFLNLFLGKAQARKFHPWQIFFVVYKSVLFWH